MRRGADANCVAAAGPRSKSCLYRVRFGFSPPSYLCRKTVPDGGGGTGTAFPRRILIVQEAPEFGLFAAMYSRVLFNRCIVQLDGHTVRCPIELLQNEFRNSEHVRDLFVSYSEQVQQTVARNSMHTTEERICRWLLMTPMGASALCANCRQSKSPNAEVLARDGTWPIDWNSKLAP